MSLGFNMRLTAANFRVFLAFPIFVVCFSKTQQGTRQRSELGAGRGSLSNRMLQPSLPPLCLYHGFGSSVQPVYIA